MVAVQKKSDAVDLGGMPRSELTLIASQGCPTEIFEVTQEIAEHHERFAQLISHRVPFAEAGHAFALTLTPGRPRRWSSPSTTRRGPPHRSRGSTRPAPARTACPRGGPRRARGPYAPPRVLRSQ
ncbi:hypothetical protein GCM10011579_050050 [Streptomyces albiflavescens]|uniref:Uncharacterized protein n=1 Tax=Streptomyces albiflavescens TaxID=1623582 RepID=A0A917Y7E0_9ACTN|nr:hypothetical protein [Streptomyces albiflavescens]GGN72657.1 hypothetical protein GCM10011579_050050 [Streptomyces albiflavescens]